MVGVGFKSWPPNYCADNPYVPLSLKKESEEGLSLAANLDPQEQGPKEGHWGFRNNRSSGPEATQQLWYQNEASSWLGVWVGKGSGLVRQGESSHVVSSVGTELEPRPGPVC